MMKKTKKIAVITTVIALIGINQVNAWETSTGAINLRPTTIEPDPKEILSKSGSTEYKCTFMPNATHTTRVAIDIYDEKYDGDSTSLIPESNIFPQNYQAIAGTALGVNLTDLGIVSWYVSDRDIKVEKKTTTTETKYKCKYKTKIPIYECDPTSDRTCVGQVSYNTYDIMSYQTTSLLQTSAEQIALVIPGCTMREKSVKNKEDCQKDMLPNCMLDGVPKPFTETKEGIWRITYESNKLDECRKHAIYTSITGKDANGNVVAGFTSANAKLQNSAQFRIDLTNSNDINGNDITIEAEEANISSVGKCKDSRGNKLTTCKFDVTASYIQEKLSELKNTGETGDQIVKHREYLKEKTCINVKTGQVSYVPTYEYSTSGEPNIIKSDCDPLTEYTIENDVVGDKTHWHYFIPLNAKSDSEVEINFMMNANGTLNSEDCKIILDRYPYDPENPNGSYVHRIVKYDKATNTVQNFNGTFLKMHADSSDLDVKRLSDDWNYLDQYADKDSACRISKRIQIPIRQGFYNEVEATDNVTNNKKIKFNGFNFYYKPIDVSSLSSSEDQTTRIFPNGISTDSDGNLTVITLWDDWYLAQKSPGKYSLAEKPDLSESYSENTYYAININPNQIREYNKNNSYTSWSNMNVNGTSKFINDEDGIIKRNIDTSEIYKLGCGPLNQYEYLKNPNGTDMYDASHNRIKNLYYQPECDRS